MPTKPAVKRRATLYQGRTPDGAGSSRTASHAAAEALATAAGKPRRQPAAVVPVSATSPPSENRVRSVVDRTISDSWRVSFHVMDASEPESPHSEPMDPRRPQ